MAKTEPTLNKNRIFKALGLSARMKGANCGGEWFAGSGDFLVSQNPTTGEVLSRIEQADPADYERRAIARKAVLVAACVLFAFALFGSAMLNHLGITLNAFRVAGGLLLFKIATDMVFAQHERETEEEAAEARERPICTMPPLLAP